MSSEMPSYERLDERLKTLSNDVAEVRKELFGNGNRGLKTAITELRQAFKIGTWVGATIVAALILDMSTRFFNVVSPKENQSSLNTLISRDISNSRNDPRAEKIAKLERKINLLLKEREK